MAEAGVEAEDEEELAQWMPICDDCDNPVEHYCTTCGDKFCTGCKNNHLSSRRYRDHQVVPYSSGMRTAQKSNSTCSKHPSERYQLYCKPCQTPVCTPCIAQAHADHSFMSITDAFSVAKDEATSALERMAKTIRPRVKNHSERVQKMATEALKSIDNSEQEIRSTSKQLHEFVDLNQEENLKQLSEMKEKRVQPVLKKQERGRDEINRKLENTMKEYEDNLRSDDPIGILFFMNGKYSRDLDSAFPIPVLEAIPSVRFDRASCSNEAMQTYSGSLTLSQIKVDDTAKAVGKESDVTRTRAVKEIAVKDNNVQSATKPSSLSIMKFPEQQKVYNLDNLYGNIAKLRHVTVDQMWILSDSNKVVLVDKGGTVLRTVDTNCSIFIGSGMCVSQDNEVVFSYYNGNHLMKISRSLHISLLFTTGNSQPYGISQLHSGEWVVCMPYGGVLRVYDRTGKVVRDIGQGHLQRPYYVAVNKVNDDICVSDNERQVVVFSGAGKKRFTYTGEGVPGSVFKPFDLCCDQLGNILITDYSNHRVYIIDKDGNFLQYFVSGKENIYYPITIDIDDRGYALIGEGQTRKVKAYKYLQ